MDEPLRSWPAPLEPAGPAPGIRFASHGARILAYLVDGVIVTVALVAVTIVAAILIAVLAEAGAEALAWIAVTALLVAAPGIAILYLPWFWANGGATPGMRMFGLRVVRDRDGTPIGWGAALLRLLGLWLGASVVYLGWVWILVDGRRRGWHDLLAGTVMVQPA